MNGEFRPTKNKLLTTLPDIHKEFQVQLQIRISSFPHGWHNVIHLTTGGNVGAYGCRIATVWANGGSNPFLHICSAISGNWNYCNNYYVSTNTWINLRMSQKKLAGGRYGFEFNVNNRIDEVVNSQPVDFTNVKVFASDPWHDSITGAIRKFEICPTGNIEQGNLENLVSYRTLRLAQILIN